MQDPDYTLNNLNRVKTLHIWSFRQKEIYLHSKDITYHQNYFKYTNIVLFQTVVTQCHVAHLAEL